MESRISTFWEYLIPIIEANRETVGKSMREAFERHRDQALSSMHDALNACNIKALKALSLGQKGQTAFIVLSFLNTAFLDESYKILVDLYDDAFYLDLSECSACFSYDFLVEAFERTVQMLTDAVKKKFMRCLDYEIDEIRWKYKDVLFGEIRDILFELLSDEATATILKEMNLKENATIMYGYYFNHQVPYYQIT